MSLPSYLITFTHSASNGCVYAKHYSRHDHRSVKGHVVKTGFEAWAGLV